MLNVGLRISGGGKHRAGGGGGGPLVAHVAAGAAYPAVTITTAPINTTGANLLVVVGQSDGSSNATLTDSKGNTWTLATSNSAYQPNVWYCLSPTVGSGHTFTLASTTNTSVTPSLAVAAFGSMVSGAFQSADAATPPGNSVQAGIVNPGIGDLCIVGIGGANGTGMAGATVDSGFTITDSISGPAFIWTGVGLAYLFYTGVSGQQLPAWSSATTYTAGKIVSRSGNNYQALFGSTNHDPLANDGWWTAPGVKAAGNVAPVVAVTSGGNGWAPVIASFAA